MSLGSCVEHTTHNLTQHITLQHLAQSTCVRGLSARKDAQRSHGRDRFTFGTCIIIKGMCDSTDEDPPVCGLLSSSPLCLLSPPAFNGNLLLTSMTPTPLHGDDGRIGCLRETLGYTQTLLSAGQQVRWRRPWLVTSCVAGLQSSSRDCRVHFLHSQDQYPPSLPARPVHRPNRGIYTYIVGLGWTARHKKARQNRDFMPGFDCCLCGWVGPSSFGGRGAARRYMMGRNNGPWNVADLFFFSKRHLFARRKPLHRGTDNSSDYEQVRLRRFAMSGLGEWGG